MEEARRRYGAREVLFAVSHGQYSHPDGLFFGGRAPTWSNRLMRQLIRDRLAPARAVAVVDLHTGLGPSGYGEPIAGTNDAARLAILRRWHGDELTSHDAGTSVSGAMTGRLVEVFASLLSATVLPIVLEFGTVPRDQVRLALRSDNWLHRFGELSSAQGRLIKRQIRDAFYPDDAEWKAKVILRCREIVNRSLAGLAALDLDDSGATR